MSIDELIRRVEGASVGSRELDAAIWATLHPDQFDNAEWYANFRGMNRADWIYIQDVGVPKLTESLDAAMTLVPEGWVGSVGVKRGSAELWLPGRAGQNQFGQSATPALALVAAALRALASKPAEENPA